VAGRVEGLVAKEGVGVGSAHLPGGWMAAAVAAAVADLTGMRDKERGKRYRSHKAQFSQKPASDNTTNTAHPPWLFSACARSFTAAY
jgi:hypothetical protein